jgi:hypothetical protein
MIFDSTVTFEPGTDRAILWADAPAGARVQVIIDPKYAINLSGLRRPLDLETFGTAIRKHLREIIKAATAAYADRELVLGLF